MRILGLLSFVFHEHGILRSLRDAGCEVAILDGQPLRRTELARTIQAFRPDLIFTYAWWLGRLSLEDLIWARRHFHVPIVYWATDDPTHHERISLPLARLADLVFTTTEELLPVYRSMGKAAGFLRFACHPALHRRVKPGLTECHDIVLVGRNYDMDFMWATYRTACMEQMVRPLAREDIDLKVYGCGWDAPTYRFHIPARYTAPEVPYTSLAEIYSAAKIVLGLQTECHSTQTTHRPFEALGCRAFHLAPATRAIASLFVPGKHLVISNSPGETLALARYYLEHEAERERIAAAGQLEVYRRHTYAHRATEFLTKVLEVL